MARDNSASIAAYFADHVHDSDDGATADPGYENADVDHSSDTAVNEPAEVDSEAQTDDLIQDQGPLPAQAAE